MTPERWRVVKEVFDCAVEQDAAGRPAYLDGVCRNDSSLRDEVESMLASDAAARTFMERPASSLKADLTALGAAHPGPAVGSMLAQYRIVSELGAGGMGRVYRAEDTRLGRTVALKVLASDRSDTAAGRARFEREARLASALDHPNICTVYEIGRTAGVSFIAMRYLDGETLQQILRDGPLQVERLLAIGDQVADALAAAHARGIVHRDVKPNNVMVSADGRAYVLDFGIAKLLHSTERAVPVVDATQSGVIFGTPSYVSPEQARGLPVDHRTDIFSFGVLLYEMATGHVPFRGPTSADIIAAILTQPHASVSDANPALPASLVTIINRALAKSPDERYSSIDAIRTDLRRVDAGAAAAGPFLAWPRRWKRVFVVLAITLALIAGLVGINRVIPRGTIVDSIVVMPFAHAQDSGDLEYLSDGIVDGMIDRLAELPSTRVIARSTAFLYKGRQVDPRAVGRDLGVAAALTGVVGRDDKTVVVRAELVDVKTGARLWAQEYSRPIDELSAVPRDVAVAVARELRTRLTGEQQRRLARDYTRSTDAYQQYLRGRFFWNKRTADGYTKAIEYFTGAVTADPTFALAYSGLADSYSGIRSYGIRSAEEMIPLARAAAERALEVDDSLAEAQASIGKIATDTYRWDEAGAAFNRAIELNPNYATAHHWQAMYFVERGRVQEALAAIRRAQALDPLSLIINTEVGRLLYFARDYDGAIAQLSKTLEMDPHFALAHLYLGTVLLEKGRYPEAIEEIRAGGAAGPASTMNIARAHAMSGHRGQAEAALQQLVSQSKTQFVPPYVLAVLYASLGDHERAIDWIDNGLRRVGGGPWFLTVNPPFDVLQSNPRYQAILRRVALVP